MNRISRRLGLLLLVLAAFALSSCGGSSSSSVSSGSTAGCSNPAGLATSFGNPTGSNVVPLTVDGGPLVNGAAVGTVNQGYVTITVCVPGTATCQNIDHVWVDTGSIGLRLFSSALTSVPAASLPLSKDASGNPIASCSQFISSYTWGALRTAAVTIGGETAASMPVQMIGDTAVPATAPSSCSSGSGGALTAMNTIPLMGANGLLGIGVFQQDCGPGCAANAVGGYYYSCTSTSCSSIVMPQAQQLQNVVGLFATDNNGSLIQIPSIPPQGQATAGGWLIFGINTQSNNQLGSALVFPADTAQGYINTTTTYGSTTNASSYVDSGSNGWFFNDPSLTACTGAASGFFCSTAMLSATMLPYQGFTGASTSHTYGFCVQDFNTLGAGAAFNDLGGPGGAGTFDWGLPFFYGRSVFTALENTTIAGNAGPFFAASTP